MKTTPPPLQIAKPCPRKWEELRGDSKRRFCDHCQLHVHNLSAMSEGERTAFVSRSGGHLCIAYLQRGDGSMVTPSGWEALRRFLAPVRRGIASLLATVLPLGLLGCASRATLGRVAPSCDTHQQKRAQPTAEGVMLLGAPLPPEPTERTSR